MSSVETYALISVSNGKFHKPKGAFERSNAFRPTDTVCGGTVTPENYFKTEADADSYTGGRLARFMCKHCATHA